MRITDIQNEVQNYKQFRKELINYIDKHPIIKYSNFKKSSFLLFIIIIKENSFKKIFIIIGGKIIIFLRNILYLQIIKL